MSRGVEINHHHCRLAAVSFVATVQPFLVLLYCCHVFQQKDVIDCVCGHGAQHIETDNC